MYRDDFIRDVRFYLRMRHIFSFDGKLNYTSKYVERYTSTNSQPKILAEKLSYNVFKDRFPQQCTDNGVLPISLGKITTHFFEIVTEQQIVYDKEGVNGIEAFYTLDSTGKVIATKHPNILTNLLRTKSSINLHIKMYAQDLAEGNWNKIELRALCIKYKAPGWFRKAIEEQRWKYVN